MGQLLRVGPQGHWLGQSRQAGWEVGAQGPPHRSGTQVSPCQSQGGPSVVSQHPGGPQRSQWQHCWTSSTASVHLWLSPIQCLTEHLLCSRPPGNPSPKKVNFSFLRMSTGIQTQSHLTPEPFQYVHLHFFLPPALLLTTAPQMSLGLP